MKMLEHTYVECRKMLTNLTTFLYITDDKFIEA